MASGTFLAVPTESNPQETECGSSLNHLALLTSEEAMGCGGKDEELYYEELTRYLVTAGKTRVH